MAESISIHAPVKGATPLSAIRWADTQDFNPRTREGCDVGHYYDSIKRIISIHAPVKGATIAPTEYTADGEKFQSTHP